VGVKLVAEGLKFQIEVIDELLKFDLAGGDKQAAKAGDEPANMVAGTLKVESVRDSQSELLRGLY
jgi:hypothetical protein